MKKSYILVLSLMLLFGCASREVSRVSADKQTDLSGKWNDTDSKLTAETMVEQSLSAPWLADYKAENGGNKPVVIVGAIGLKNSTEHINTMTFVKDIQKSLINSGKVKFVASSSERGQVRDERMQQQEHASMETAKRLAAETGADFMLTGEISVILDEYDGKEAKFYQIDLQLINVETNEIAWVGDKKIKKLIGKNSHKW